jgi:hypothetical protein
MKVKNQLAAAVVLALGVVGNALAVDPTTAAEAFTQASTAATGFGPGMWGLAAAAVGIMIGVKWIKRARGAA